MTTFTAQAFQKALGIRFRDNREFLEYFKTYGCYLDDLSHTPVDNLPKKQREEFLKAGIGELAQRIHEMNPGVLVIALKKIEHYVREAVYRSQRQPEIFALPFPGHGHQGKYIDELCKIISMHLPVQT
jgi:hypothetical protein